MFRNTFLKWSRYRNWTVTVLYKQLLTKPVCLHKKLMNLSANSTLYYVCCWWCCCCPHVRSTALPKLYFVTLQNDIPVEFLSANVQTQNLSNYSHNVWYYRISSVIPCMKCDYYCHATMATIWPATLNEKHSIFMVVLHQGYETDKLNNTLKTNTPAPKCTDLIRPGSVQVLLTTKPMWVKKDSNNRSWVSTVQMFKKIKPVC